MYSQELKTHMKFWGSFLCQFCNRLLPPSGWVFSCYTCHGCNKATLLAGNKSEYLCTAHLMISHGTLMRPRHSGWESFCEKKKKEIKLQYNKLYFSVDLFIDQCIKNVTHIEPCLCVSSRWWRSNHFLWKTGAPRTKLCRVNWAESGIVGVLCHQKALISTDWSTSWTQHPEGRATEPMSRCWESCEAN